MRKTRQLEARQTICCWAESS